MLRIIHRGRWIILLNLVLTLILNAAGHRVEPLALISILAVSVVAHSYVVDFLERTDV